MPIIKPVNGKSPQIPNSCYIAENATIVGDVTMGDDCSVWFNAVIRGDVHYIKMGNLFFINLDRPITWFYHKDRRVIPQRYFIFPFAVGNNYITSI